MNYFDDDSISEIDDDYDINEDDMDSDYFEEQNAEAEPPYFE